MTKNGNVARYNKVSLPILQNDQAYYDTPSLKGLALVSNTAV
jgi:hypothetical protein